MPNMPAIPQPFAESDVPLSASHLGGERRLVRRRPTMQQGQSLEILGHAIEYLVDSELNSGDVIPSDETGEAVRILMALNRQVFAECLEVVPLGQRVRRCLTNMFGRPALLPSNQ